MKSLMKMIMKLFRFLPKWTLKNYIVLESVPDLSDNTRAVFDEMINRGMNNKYKFIWLIENTNHKILNLKNVKFVNKNSKKKYWYLFFCKCGICCNGKIFSWRRGQFSIYLSHGFPIKSVRVSVGELCDKIDWWLTTSENVKEIFSYEFRAKYECGVALGYPRNDSFSEAPKDLHLYFDDVSFNKVIIWYPTFRQNKGGIAASNSSDALPIICDEDKARRLNDFAIKNNLLVVLKPHFAQDVNYMKDLKLSNIRFIDDEFLYRNNLKSYELVGSSDALLTDYSSIYYDFTLADKPIGLIWEDYEDYKENPGFAVNMEYYMKGGEKIYTIEDLESFLTRVVKNVDALIEERREIRDYVHCYADGKNSERVVDFIIEKAKL